MTNVHQTLFQILYGLLLLGWSPKTAEKIYPHRKFLHTLNKGIIMLLGQNSRWHQIYHLAAFLHCFERCTNCHFRFPIAYVSADQTVHDFLTFHIIFRILNGTLLILCLLIREQFFKLPLPHGIRTVYITLLCLTCRIKFHQIFCNFLYSTFSLLSGSSSSLHPQELLSLGVLFASMLLYFWMASSWVASI